MARPKKPAKRVTYHVTPSGKSWGVQREGAQKPVKKHGRKADAIDHAREIAMRQELGQVVVHRRDGSIQTEWTYSRSL